MSVGGKQKLGPKIKNLKKRSYDYFFTVIPRDEEIINLILPNKNMIEEKPIDVLAKYYVRFKEKQSRFIHLWGYIKARREEYKIYSIYTPEEWWGLVNKKPSGHYASFLYILANNIVNFMGKKVMAHEHIWSDTRIKREKKIEDVNAIIVRSISKWTKISRRQNKHGTYEHYESLKAKEIIRYMGEKTVNLRSFYIFIVLDFKVRSEWA